MAVIKETPLTIEVDAEAYFHNPALRSMKLSFASRESKVNIKVGDDVGNTVQLSYDDAKALAAFINFHLGE